MNIFRRDGRDIGSNNFLTVASHLTKEIWEPLEDITLGEALGNIKIVWEEVVPARVALRRMERD